MTALGDINLQVQTADPAHVQISRGLEQMITAGELEPGTRLPPNTQLAKRWGVSCTSVQKAMNHLRASGRVERTPGRGTFVRPNTERANIAMIFGPSLSVEPSHFYRAVFRALETEMAARHWAPRVYDGFIASGGVIPPADARMCRQLVADLHHHNFKGLIEFALLPETEIAAPERAALPKVIWGAGSDTDFRLDEYQFARQSVHFLAAQGRRKITYLNFAGSGPHEPVSRQMDAGFADTLRELGLPPVHSGPIRLGNFPLDSERVICDNVRQLLREWFSVGRTAECPDALLVDDDIAMRAVALALLQAGVKVPEQVMIVCLANEDFNLHYGISVIRYEFSARDIARQLLNLLWKRITNEPLPKLPVLIGGRISGDGIT